MDFHALLLVAILRAATLFLRHYHVVFHTRRAIQAMLMITPLAAHVLRDGRCYVEPCCYYWRVDAMALLF